MAIGFFEKLFRFDERELKKYQKEADKVIALEKTIAALTDDELRAKTDYFKQKLANGAKTDDIKYEAFAVAREAAKRVLGQFPYKVQIVGALVLDKGDVAEMKTGEGKTLTATMAVYLNALKGEGVHVITVNEYLAQRDADWMGQIYRFLGLTVGVNLRSKTTSEKQEAYRCDITYSTNSELGFDYLRDNMVQNVKNRVLRGLKYAVVDEADSVLIDESRTPLIISGGARASASQYTVADRFVKTLSRADFEIDIKQKSVFLTEEGNKKATRMFGVKNIYDPEHADLVHRITQALKANYIFKRNVEYMVDQDRQIQLIDQFTGRVLHGREYSDGLQQAIQAKENVEIKQETITIATITYQNFFRLYKKMSGMTGTAKTEEEEFRKIYNMRVVSIPTNRPIKRIDALDSVFAHKDAKLRALVNEVKERHEKGQPILIGTVSVESSEEVSQLLTAAGLPNHEVLNAKNHAREAEIIKNAGLKGAITIATNMAGRGTDIKIDDEVKALGGLCVFGTERHESRRIDNQLRGRSGRQGDPGFSRFYVSFDDELMRRFANERVIKMFEQYGDEAIESKLITSVITNAQKQIEGKNFDIRKNLLEYDDVNAKQREAIYGKRDVILLSKDSTALINEMFDTAGKTLANRAVSEKGSKMVDVDMLKKLLEPRFMNPGVYHEEDFQETSVKEAGEILSDLLHQLYDLRKKQWAPEIADSVERQIMLQTIDQNWTKHIDSLARLRDSIHLRSYANTNPLQDYVNEGYQLYNDMLDTIAVDVVMKFLNVVVTINKPAEEPKPAAEEVDLTKEDKKE